MTDSNQHSTPWYEAIENLGATIRYAYTEGPARSAAEDDLAVIARAAAQSVDRSEWREGMVTVYDYEGRLVGSMGQESWAWLLEQGYEKCRRAVEQFEALREAVRQVGNAYGCYAGCTAGLPGGGPDKHTPACAAVRAALASYPARGPD